MAINGRGVPRWTRHSLVLIMAGTIYFGIGIALLFLPNDAKRVSTIKTAQDIMPMTAWALIFVLVGFFASLSSFLNLGRRPWGYMALTAMSSAWACIYLLAVIFEKAPSITLVSAFTWFLLAAIWIGVSGLVAPEQLEARMEERYGRREPD